MISYIKILKDSFDIQQFYFWKEKHLFEKWMFISI